MSQATRHLPTFDLAVSGGGRLTSKDLEGKRCVLYFYPKDDTPGCTIEAGEFTALRPQFERKGVTVYGVSPDSASSHDRFVAKCDIGVDLISDPDKVLCNAFDVWKEKSMMGRTYMGVERSTFLISANGDVEREWIKVSAPGHAQEVLDSI